MSMHYKYRCSRCKKFVYAPEGVEPGDQTCLERGCEGTYRVCIYASGRRQNEPVTLKKIDPTKHRVYSEVAAHAKSNKRSKTEPIYYISSSDEDEDRVRPSITDEGDCDDGGEFLPPSAHHPGQRYTTNDYMGRDGRYYFSPLPTGAKYSKYTALRPISAAAPSGGQADAMGGVSAVEHAQDNGRTLQVPTVASEKYQPVAEEWCHLIAACLGGKIEPKNLVAASHACNTFMYEIENYVKGRTDLAVRVSSYGNHPSVAEYIQYEIFKINPRKGRKPFVTKKTSFWIDARAHGFSKRDGEKVRKDLRSAVPHPRLRY